MNFVHKKILVVDDDPTIAESTCLILNEYGYDATSITDVENLYKLDENLPDVFLLDLWMSGHDGRDITKYLKRKNSTKNIPIIMISASRNLVKSAKDAGADDFIEKPFDMHDLIKKIKLCVK